MVFSKTNMSGLDFAFPDCCNTLVGTATVPLPYPNMAFPSVAVPTQYTTYNECLPAHNLATTTSVTTGDTTGTLGGVASATFMGAAYHTTCSTSVWYGTSLATRMLDVTIQNTSNAVGAALVPSQTLVMILA